MSAVFAALLIASAASASAASSASLTGGGWFFIFNPNAPNFSAEVNFGITARYSNGVPQGHFNYYDRFTGLQANGVIDTLSFGPPSGNCKPSSTTPSAVITGHCTDGSCSSFSMEVQDNGEPGKNNDYVCQVNVQGQSNQSAAPLADSDNAKPLNGGNVQIH